MVAVMANARMAVKSPNALTAFRVRCEELEFHRIQVWTRINPRGKAIIPRSIQGRNSARNGDRHSQAKGTRANEVRSIKIANTNLMVKNLFLRYVGCEDFLHFLLAVPRWIIQSSRNIVGSLSIHVRSFIQ